MSKMSDEWVREQLAAARVTIEQGEAILTLMKTWDDIVLPDDQSSKALELFAGLAVGHPVIEDEKPGEWFDAVPGAITTGDVVRVKADAFDGAAAPIHNGRVGKVVGIRYGDIIFKSTDGKDPRHDSTHYSPYKLQKLVK